MRSAASRSSSIALRWPRAASTRPARRAPGVAGERRERGAVLVLGRAEPTAAELELAELESRPGDGLALLPACLGGEAHRVDRARDVADQLARVGDARVRGEAGLERGHAIVGAKGLGVTAS